MPGDIYGPALNGIRVYADYHTNQNKQLFQAASDAANSTDPGVIQQSYMKIQNALDSIDYAQGAAGILLKLIELPN